MRDADLWGERIGILDGVTEPKVLTEAQIRWKDEDDARRILDETFQTVEYEDEEVEVEVEVRKPEETPGVNPIEPKTHN
jgi:hypothetical protein